MTAAITLVHLSDTHLTEAGVRYNGVIDAGAALSAAVAEIRRGMSNGHRIDAVIASGDLTDTGDPSAYRHLRAELTALGLPVIWCTGNHDVRTTFHRELLDHTDVTDRPLLQHHVLPGGVRVLVLDSTVTGKGHGVLAPELLAELTVALQGPADRGTVLVLHHAPLPAPSPLLDYFTLLPDSMAALAEVIDGTDVQLILAGHHHLARHGMLGSVPVVVAGSTAIRTDPLGPIGHERTTRSASMNLIQLWPCGPGRFSPTTSVIPLDAAGEVFDLDPQACAAVIAAYPIEDAPTRDTSSPASQAPASR